MARRPRSAQARRQARDAGAAGFGTLHRALKAAALPLPRRVAGPRAAARATGFATLHRAPKAAGLIAVVAGLPRTRRPERMRGGGGSALSRTTATARRRMRTNSFRSSTWFRPRMMTTFSQNQVQILINTFSLFQQINEENCQYRRHLETLEEMYDEAAEKNKVLTNKLKRARKKINSLQHKLDKRDVQQKPGT